jgi:hypothetical protein
MAALTISDRNALLRVSDKISAALERRLSLWTCLFVLLFLACAAWEDVHKLMWVDELFTLHAARQGSLAGVAEFSRASDGVPPLYEMIVSAILPVVRSEALAVRLPSTLGFCFMIVCLVAFCRRRLPAIYSISAALLACDTCLPYSTEGRCYGLILGCAAGALLCWQYAVDGRHRALAIPLLGLCLALLPALHYYAVFFLVPLFLAETVRWRISGKPDWAIFAAMSTALVVLALHYSFIAAGSRYQKHFWSPAKWAHIPAFYNDFFWPILGICLIPFCLTVVLLSATDKAHAGALHTGLAPAEWTAVAAFSLMPVFVVVASEYTTHVFVTRYVLWAVPGFAILAAALLWRAAGGQAIAGLSLAWLALSIIAIHEVRDVRRKPVLRESEAVHQALKSLPYGTEPIVVADAHAFIELSYYSESRIRNRLVYPVSEELELRYIGSDTNSLLLPALRRYTDLNVVDYKTVAASYPRFVLATLSEDGLAWDLIRAGYRVVPIGSSPAPLLFNVEAPGMRQ